MARYRVYAQLSELQISHLANVSICTSASQLQCTIHILGARGSPYELGSFQLRLKFQDDYPYTPPEVQFLTPILHCNVSDEGTFIHRSLCCEWNSSRTLLSLVEAILGAMVRPDLRCASSDRSELCALYTTDAAHYVASVVTHTVKYGLWDSN